MTIHLPNDWKLISDEGAKLILAGPADCCFEIPYNSYFKLDISGEPTLHVFRGMQYLGPMERDDWIKEKIKELLVKFQGAIVVTLGVNCVDIIKDVVVVSGCGSIVDIIGPHNLHDIGCSRDGGAKYWRIRGDSVSLTSVRAAKVNKEEFTNNYERMMQL